MTENAIQIVLTPKKYFIGLLAEVRDRLQAMLFIRLLNKWTACCMPGTVIGAGDPPVNKIA